MMHYDICYIQRGDVCTPCELCDLYDPYEEDCPFRKCPLPLTGYFKQLNF